jgi:hypothetical protein
MSTQLSEKYSIKHNHSLEEGIIKTINWFIENKNYDKNRYNVFLQK